MSSENCSAVGVDFAEGDGTHSGSFESETEAADAAEEVEDTHDSLQSVDLIGHRVLRGCARSGKAGSRGSTRRVWRPTPARNRAAAAPGRLGPASCDAPRRARSRAPDARAAPRAHPRG